jgi:hypothetical protein
VRMFGDDSDTKTKTAAKTKNAANTKTAAKTTTADSKSTAQRKSSSSPSGSRPGRAKTSAAAGKAGGTAKATGTAMSGKSGTSRRPGGGKKRSGKAGASSGRKDDALTRSQLPLAARVVILIVAFAAMVGFAVVLSKLTLGPSAASESLTHSNLRPGDSIRDYLAQPGLRDTLKQLGGNVVLGMPFGALLPALVPRTRGLLRVMLATALVMLLVELVQGALVTGRAFDIDDVILNTTGAMLGYVLIGRRLGLAVHPRRRHWWHRLRVSSSRRR